MIKKAHCPKCDKEVNVIETSLGGGDSSEYRCADCGHVMFRRMPDGSITSAAPSSASGAIITAGYDSLQSDILAAAFKRGGYGDVRVNCKNGEELLIEATRQLTNGKRPSLILVEVSMPIMNGINAAIALRSIEKGIARGKVPILFFTAKPLDEQFVRAIKFLAPAKYVPIPPNASPENFRERSEQVVGLLKKEEW